MIVKVKPDLKSSTGTYEILGRHTFAGNAQGTLVINSNLLTTYVSTLSSTGNAVWNPSQIPTPILNNSEVKFFSYVYNGNKAILSDFPKYKSEKYFSGNLVPQTGNTKIGKYIAPGIIDQDYYVGTIDEVRIYNRALSDSEVSAQYDAIR